MYTQTLGKWGTRYAVFVSFGTIILRQQPSPTSIKSVKMVKYWVIYEALKFLLWYRTVFKTYGFRLLTFKYSKIDPSFVFTKIFTKITTWNISWGLLSQQKTKGRCSHQIPYPVVYLVHYYYDRRLIYCWTWRKKWIVRHSIYSPLIGWSQSLLFVIFAQHVRCKHDENEHFGPLRSPKLGRFKI